MIEIILGVIILAIVGVLGTIPPAAHTQASWPFAVRFSFEAFSDPSRRLAAILTIAALVVGAMVILGGIVLRRLWWTLLAVGALVAVAFGPGLSLLTVRAFPTSYFASPTGYSARSIAAGEELFLSHCVSCHGEHGQGDGPAAKDLQPPPADLTGERIYRHRDGDLFWWVSHGIGNAMPGFIKNFDTIAR